MTAGHDTPSALLEDTVLCICFIYLFFLFVFDNDSHTHKHERVIVIGCPASLETI